MTHDQRVDEVAKALQKAIDSCKCLDSKQIGETEYCEIVLEALGAIEEGKQMRLQELEEEAESNEEDE
jgi:hypothetical protein